METARAVAPALARCRVGVDLDVAGGRHVGAPISTRRTPRRDIRLGHVPRPAPRPPAAEMVLDARVAGVLRRRR